MEPITDEMVDRLFGCLHEFYGERWSKQFKDTHRLAFVKTMWRNGLSGLNYDAIKKALYYYRGHAKSPSSTPPIVTDFFRIAVGHMQAI